MVRMTDRSLINPRRVPVLVAILCRKHTPTVPAFSAHPESDPRSPVSCAMSAPISTAVRIVESAGDAYAGLLGTGSEHKRKINEFLVYLTSVSPTILLTKLDEELRERAYLVGDSFSLADAVAFDLTDCTYHNALDDADVIRNIPLLSFL